MGEMNLKFEEFLTEYGKSYLDQSEKNARRDNFIKNYNLTLH